MEYQLDGTPVVGSVGTWSLDKRHYFGAAPPPNLHPPPRCAQESGRVWHAMFNEAIGNLSASGQWYARTGQNLQRTDKDASTERNLRTLGVELVEAGPWLIDGAPLHFYRRGVVWSKWGGGTWSVTGDRTVELHLCKMHTLTFDDDAHPTRFDYPRSDGSQGRGVRDPQYAAAAAVIESVTGDAPTSVTMGRLLGHGPWAFGDAPISGGQNPLAFYRGGLVATPAGPAQYRAFPGDGDVVELTYQGEKHNLSTATVIGCYQATAVRHRDGHPMRAWIMMRHVSMEYTGWRDAWGCRM